MEDPKVDSYTTLKAMLDTIEINEWSPFSNWRITIDSYDVYGNNPKLCAIQLRFERPDTKTGVMGVGKGRVEYVENGWTYSAVVKTVWTLMELLVRHELMESFMVEGHRVFDPHATVRQLIGLDPRG